MNNRQKVEAMLRRISQYVESYDNPKMPKGDIEPDADMLRQALVPAYAWATGGEEDPDPSQTNGDQS